MNQRTLFTLVAIVATTGILVTAFSIVISSANADSSTDQSAQKFDKKCTKAVEEGSFKKGDQAAQQFEHHDPDTPELCAAG
jgi:hypothetical protein